MSLVRSGATSAAWLVGRAASRGRCLLVSSTFYVAAAPCRHCTISCRHCLLVGSPNRYPPPIPLFAVLTLLNYTVFILLVFDALMIWSFGVCVSSYLYDKMQTSITLTSRRQQPIIIRFICAVGRGRCVWTSDFLSHRVACAFDISHLLWIDVLYWRFHAPLCRKARERCDLYPSPLCNNTLFIILTCACRDPAFSNPIEISAQSVIIERESVAQDDVVGEDEEEGVGSDKGDSALVKKKKSKRRGACGRFISGTLDVIAKFGP